MTQPNEAVQQLASRLLETGFEQMTPRERRVVERVAKRMAVSRDVVHEFHQGLSFGQRLADKIAAFGGSWPFLILFGLFIAVWVAVNWGRAGFDPYPFILLNLLLSMIAAIQAPVIMMSQNRQSAKDRVQAEHDYEVNLKAEIEIMALHEKLDEIRSKELAELLKKRR
jgi:uncharacterized membrane protein